jgi:predicted RNA-binding Zn ribbon-like protein
MEFAHDTSLSLQALVALVNSAEPETLDTLEQLDAFCERWQWTGSRARDAAELEAVRALRPRLRALWSLPEEGVVEQLNWLLRQGRALPQLVRHDHFDWHIHATPPEANLATRMAVEAAVALVDVVRSGELGRLRTCADPECDNVLIDLSRNRSRRFCDAGCGNRANVAAYRARRRDTAG